MSEKLINETERELAAYKCRKLWRDTECAMLLYQVPQGYNDNQAAAWMRQASQIIDEKLGRTVRGEAA